MNSTEAVSYVYEYMVRRCMPFIKVPPVLNTVMVQVCNHHKIQEFILAYDREGLKDVVALLIQNYSDHLHGFDKILIDNYDTPPAILKKYLFECRNLALLEFYDFLLMNGDDFITTLKLKVSKASSDTVEFWVMLDSIMVLDSKGNESKRLSDQKKVEWRVWKNILNHETDFSTFIDTQPMGTYLLYAACVPAPVNIK